MAEAAVAPMQMAEAAVVPMQMAEAAVAPMQMAEVAVALSPSAFWQKAMPMVMATMKLQSQQSQIMNVAYGMDNATGQPIAYSQNLPAL